MIKAACDAETQEYGSFTSRMNRAGKANEKARTIIASKKFAKGVEV